MPTCCSSSARTPQLRHRMTEFRETLKRIPGLRAANRLVRSASRSARLATTRSRFVHTWPPGTFYSPLPAPEDIPSAVPKHDRAIPGIDLRVQGQLALVDDLARFYAEFPFGEQPRPDHRFHLDNDFFSYCDAVVLFGMMRHLRPRRIVEVGSGFSSSLMLDTRDLFHDVDPHLTFIDPYPQRLQSLMRPEDRTRATVIPKKVQEVDPAAFDALEAGDILFIDSSHVVKLNSDVALLLFEILPRLAPGVIVHFHDIPWPFEYPVTWLKNGRAWNEAYALRAFLQYNERFEILFFNDYMASVHEEVMRATMPLTLERSATNELLLPASSLWLRRTA